MVYEYKKKYYFDYEEFSQDPIKFSIESTVYFLKSKFSQSLQLKVTQKNAILNDAILNPFG